VGLAAPQVGVNVRLMVYNPVGERGQGEEYVLVNPQIVKYGKNQDVFAEGCLSFPTFGSDPKKAPTIEADVERPKSVRVEAQDIKGKKFAMTLKEWQARIFQHEYDHLEGTLYFDRMSPEVLDSIQLDLKVIFCTSSLDYCVECFSRR
jgi:peptide deformylase